MPKYKIKKKRAKAKESARKEVESVKLLGMTLNEKKLFKQNLQNLKGMQALKNKNNKKAEKHFKKMGKV